MFWMQKRKKILFGWIEETCCYRLVRYGLHKCEYESDTYTDKSDWVRVKYVNLMFFLFHFSTPCLALCVIIIKIWVCDVTNLFNEMCLSDKIPQEIRASRPPKNYIISWKNAWNTHSSSWKNARAKFHRSLCVGFRFLLIWTSVFS